MDGSKRPVSGILVVQCPFMGRAPGSWLDESAILWFRQKFECPGPSMWPLGHLGQIQCTHIYGRGWMSWTPPHPHWQAPKANWAKYNGHIWQVDWMSCPLHSQTSHCSLAVVLVLLLVYLSWPRDLDLWTRNISQNSCPNPPNGHNCRLSSLCRNGEKWI